jgi:hypothetical protein
MSGVLEGEGEIWFFPGAACGAWISCTKACAASRWGSLPEEWALLPREADDEADVAEVPNEGDANDDPEHDRPEVGVP